MTVLYVSICFFSTGLLKEKNIGCGMAVFYWPFTQNDNCTGHSTDDGCGHSSDDGMTIFCWSLAK